MMRLLDDKDLTEKGIRPRSRAQRWRLIKAGKFPKPLRIGMRNLWPEHEIDTWQSAQIATAMIERDGVVS